MLNFLYKYLLLNKHVSIPGVGNFTIKQISAEYDEGNRIIAPPSHQVYFQHSTALTDKSFYHFLSEELRITEVEAIRKFQDFSYQLRKDIQANTFIELIGLGKLKRDPIGEIIFEPEFSTTSYYPSIEVHEVKQVPVGTIEQVIITEQPVIEEAVDKETIIQDRWWIWALVLAFIALAAMTYYYMQETY